MSDSEEEEPQDWRALDARVLKRGEKDHAPDGTIVQKTVLQQSRDAMYTALSKPASSIEKNVVECDWQPEMSRGAVRKVKGNYFNTIGWSQGVNLYVHPEEINYLVQRGSMVCYYRDQPLTVEGVLAHTLSHISMEKLQVYSYLKRLGYVVRRPLHSQVYNSDDDKTQRPLDDISGSRHQFSLAWTILGNNFSKMAWKPFYPSYHSLYRDLQWVQAKQPLPLRKERENDFDFFVWKPSANFKRSRPPPPDFRIRVASADEPMPMLSSLEQDFELVSISPSVKNATVTRMREGYRNFVYAVVDSGVVSFVRASEPQVEYISW